MDDKPIEIEGRLYHARDGVVLVDPEGGEPIPYHICICFARDSADCVCGAWDYPIPEREQ